MKSPRAPTLRDLFASFSTFIALGFGVGLIPFWPGTFGSLLGLFLAWPLRSVYPSFQVALIGAGFVIGVCACGRTGSELASHDHSAIVWDEVVGMAAVSLLVPTGTLWLMISFATFRLFDILKPWPIYLVDKKICNGFGVMLDDALASAYAVTTVTTLNLILVELSR